MILTALCKTLQYFCEKKCNTFISVRHSETSEKVINIFQNNSSRFGGTKKLRRKR